MSRYKPVFDFLTGLAVLTVPFVALRVLIKANFNFGVASALATGTEPVRLVLSALLLALPVVLTGAGYACVFQGARRAVRAKKAHLLVFLRWTAVGLLFLLPGVLTLDAWDVPTLLAVAMILGVSTILGLAYDNAEGADRQLVRTLIWLTPGLLAAALLFLACVGPMWLPPERVNVKHHAELAYVLSWDDKEAVLFLPKRDAVQRFDTADLSDRQFCRQTDYDTIADALFGAPEGLPVCPT